jgi:hypothetical protein
MKKTNLILIILVVLLTATITVIYIVRNTDKKTVFRDFAVQDTATVDKIFLIDKNNNSVLLERKENFWTANEKYKARRDFTNLLLETIKKLEVSAPVPDSKLDKVLKDLSVSGVKCEIYQNGELSKTYYIGGVTDDNTGTYMIMEESDVPFILRIPGFNGFLNVRYNTEINEWREKIIFNYQFQDIAKVKVEYPGNNSESFIAVSNGNNTFNLTELNGKPVNFRFDTIKVKEFISSCKFIGFEAYIMDSLQQFKCDSLSKQPVLARYTIEDIKGKKRSFKTHYRQNINKYMDDDGNLYAWDIDRLYGVIDDKEVVLLQYFIIDPITIAKSDFSIAPSE